MKKTTKCKLEKMMNVVIDLNDKLSQIDKVNENELDNIFHSVEFSTKEIEEESYSVREFKRNLENELMKCNCYELARCVVKMNIDYASIDMENIPILEYKDKKLKVINFVTKTYEDELNENMINHVVTEINVNEKFTNVIKNKCFLYKYIYNGVREYAYSFLVKISNSLETWVYVSNEPLTEHEFNSLCEYAL